MPEIYVAHLAAYNDGILIGEWIDAAQESDDIEIEIQEMLVGSDYDGEEWAIHDTDNFQGININKYESLEDVSMLAQLLEEFGEPFAAIYNYDSSLADDFQEWKDFMEEHYMGQYEDMAAYAEEYIQDTGILSGADDVLVNYFDFESFGRDLEYDLITVPSAHGIHIFLA